MKPKKNMNGIKMKLEQHFSSSLKVKRMLQRKQFKQRKHSSKGIRKLTSTFISSPPETSFTSDFSCSASGSVSSSGSRSSVCTSRKGRKSIQSVGLGEYTVVKELASSKGHITQVECGTCHLTMLKNNFKRHFAVLHQDPETWNFLCHICDERFPTKEYLKGHLKLGSHQQKARRNYRTTASTSTFQVETLTKKLSSKVTRKRDNQFESSMIDTKKRKVDKQPNKKKNNNNNHESSGIRTLLNESHEQTTDSTSTTGPSKNQMVTCPECDHVMLKKSFTSHFIKYHIGQKLSKGYKKSSSSATDIRSKLAKRHAKSSASKSADKPEYFTNQANKVQCSQCGKEYSGPKSCLVHYKSRHTDPNTWTNQCNKCGSSFAYGHQLRKHMQTDKFRKGKCDSLRSLNSSSSASSHSPFSSPRSSTSSTCTALSTEEYETSAIVSSDFSKQNEPPFLQHQEDSFDCSLVSNQDCSLVESDRNKCDICLSNFVNLEQHKKSENYLYGICDQDRVLCCKIKDALRSGKYFSDDEQIDIKQKIEQLKAWFQSEETQEKKNGNKKHNSDLNETRVNCPHCDKTMNSNYLDQHVTAKHTHPSTWKYDCHLCEKVFPVWQYFRHHLVKSHKLVINVEELNRIKLSKDDQLQLAVIGKDVSNSRTPLVECSHCGLFLQKGNLSRHLKRKHPDSSASASSADVQSVSKLSRTEFYRQLKKKLRSKSSAEHTSNVYENQANLLPNSNKGELNKNTLDLNCPEVFKCSACPIIPAFGTSYELIDHLQIFHVFSKSTPQCGPVRPVEITPEMDFLPTASLLDSHNHTYLNLSPSSSVFNYNDCQNNTFSPLVPPSGCMSDQSNHYQQLSQPTNLDPLIDSFDERMMLGNDPNMWQFVNEMGIDSENLMNAQENCFMT